MVEFIEVFLSMISIIKRYYGLFLFGFFFFVWLLLFALRHVDTFAFSYTFVREKSGVILEDSFSYRDDRYWLFWVQDQQVVPFFSKGVLRIKGESSFPGNKHVGYESVHFTDLSGAVLEVDMKGDGTSSDTSFHLCGHDPTRPLEFPDYWFEIVVKNKRPYIAWVDETGYSNNYSVDRVINCCNLDCSKLFHSYKIVWDNQTHRIEGFVRGLNDWVSIGATKILLSKVKFELKSVTQAAGIRRDIMFDRFRVYHQPKKVPVMFSFEDVHESHSLLALYTDQGRLIQQFDLTKKQTYQVYLGDYFDSFPASIRLFSKGPFGFRRFLFSKTLSSVYPGDRWVLRRE